MTTYDLSTGTLPSGMTYSRSDSVSTYIDSSGALQKAASNVPRHTYKYSGSSWVRAGVAIGPARVSGCPYGTAPYANWQNLSSPSVTSASTYADAVFTAPASVARGSSGSASSRYRSPSANSFTLTAGNTYIVQVFIRFGTSGLVRLGFDDLTASANSFLVINTNGTVTASSTAAGPMALGELQNLGGGLYSAWASIVPGASNSFVVSSGPSGVATSEDVKLLGAGRFDAYPLPYGRSFRSNLPVPASGTSPVAVAADVLTLTSLLDDQYRVIFTFDDGTAETRSADTSSGSYVVPTNLRRETIASIELVAWEATPTWQHVYNADIVTTGLRNWLGDTLTSSDTDHTLALNVATNRQCLVKAEIWPGMLSVNNANRSEITLAPTDRYKFVPWDEDVWVSFQFAVQADIVPTVASTCVIHQWHAYPTPSNAADGPFATLRVEPGGTGGTYRLRLATNGEYSYPTTGDNRTYRHSVDLTYASLADDFDDLIWHEVVMRLRFSRSSETGKIDYYLDGSLAFSESSIDMGAVGPAGAWPGSYPKFGAYRNPKTPEDDTAEPRFRVWFAAIEIQPQSLSSRVSAPLPRL